jgi:hypothetical protein
MMNLKNLQALRDIIDTSIKNLQAARDAIDQTLEGEVKTKVPKRPTKKEMLIEKYRQKFFGYTQKANAKKANEKPTTKKQAEKNSKN